MNLKLVSMLAVTLPVAVFAQDAFDKHCANIQLLQDKTVQKELKITEAQRNKMNVSANTYTKAAQAIAKGKTQATDADRAKLLQAGQKLKDGVVAVLNPAQLRRLREISLQFLDARAVADDKVAARIGLSADQLKRYRNVLTKNFKSAETIQRGEIEPILKKYQSKKPKNADEAKKLQAQLDAEIAAATKRIQPKLNALSASASKQLKAILTAKQLAAFEALKGKAFRP